MEKFINGIAFISVKWISKCSISAGICINSSTLWTGLTPQNKQNCVPSQKNTFLYAIKGPKYYSWTIPKPAHRYLKSCSNSEIGDYLNHVKRPSAQQLSCEPGLSSAAEECTPSVIATKAGREKWDPAVAQGKNIPHSLSFADTLGTTCIMQDNHL